MTPIKIALAALSAAIVVLLGVLSYLYWPDDAYDAGYGRAYEQAWSTWMLSLPPDQACQQVVHDVLVTQKTELIKTDMGPQERQQVIDRIAHGCRSGYYDGVSYRRNQLGMSPP